MGNSIRVIVVGAGYGGILTAKKLARRIKKVGSPVELVIIDKNPFHTMLTELHEVAADRVSEDAIKIPLKKIFANRPVTVLQEHVSHVDYQQKIVHTDQGTHSYDYLVIGSGSKPTFFGVEGAEANSFKLWSYDDAVLLKDHIQNCFRLASREKEPKKRQELLTFVTVGAGFTGVEMVGELAEWVPKLCTIHDIPREDVRVIVADQLPKILPIFPDSLIEKAANRLRRLGVEIITGTGINKISPNGVTLGTSDYIPARTVIWTAGVESSELLAKAELKKAGRNRIVTNGYLQSEEDSSVYVVGDNIFYIPEGDDKPVPQMVENAEHSAETVAHNIIASMMGKPLKTYKPAFHGAMVCVGGRYGVAHLGLPGKFFGLSGFFALFVKHFINVIYFLQVAGFNKVWSYAMHEVFHIKDRRSLIGGHLSKASPNFWLLPLRLFVGYKWLTEGLDKLPKVLEDPSKIFLIPPSPNAVVSGATEAAGQVAGQAADAVTAATQTAGSATQVSTWGTALPVPDWLKSISDTMMNVMFYQPDGSYTTLAAVFQTCMVFAEIAVGFMLIVGLFTAVASILTIGMGAMIYVSGMAPTEMVWYWVAGVALIGGAGSVFGLDYYVYPVLKKSWKNIPIIKKYYLYTD